ncbi:siderophore ferric iron reductase [Marinospirillum sp.]|uniref:siderophore ferric iron reductase n=1 Tax=Marinospirillum sp. TaxID=2183934 RepID=UPI0028708B1D|nr:siderophore ferric iron reductase [Marinospirillum sp.]MDR9467555.1 siderophore ferric iron reductase [Marinospirillum sp.]
MSLRNNANPDESLTQLLQQVQSLLPGMRSYQGEPRPGELRVTQDNFSGLKALVEHQAQSWPEAGRLYWFARSWSLLLWKPVVLALVAVHFLQRPLNLQLLGQKGDEAGLTEFSLPARALHPVSSQALRQQAGILKATSEAWQQQLGAVIRVNPALARGLLADRLLSGLLHLQASLNADNAWLAETADTWLQELELQKASGLMSVQLDSGQQRLVLNRKTCCQHYRRRDGELCNTCPRLGREERLLRLKQEHEKHATAQ